eukprot:m.50486 g.50486  ORF g.50486 m.50486 type:complete len:394 (+) comp13424_c0_seq1:167-1348(+)
MMRAFVLALAVTSFAMTEAASSSSSHTIAASSTSSTASTTTTSTNSSATTASSSSSTTMASSTSISSTTVANTTAAPSTTTTSTPGSNTTITTTPATTTPATTTSGSNTTTDFTTPTSAPTTKPSPSKPDRSAIITIFPTGTCDLAGLNSQIFFVHAPETNTSCYPLADSPFFYKLALDAKQEKVVYAKLDCKDSTCSSCGVDIKSSAMDQCLSSATHSDRSFVIRAEAKGVCLGGATTPSSKDMIEILYQNALDKDGCNANATNVTVTNLGPITNNCQPQTDPNFFRQLTYTNKQYEYASECRENLEPMCLGCERQPKVIQLGDCLAPDSFGRVEIRQADYLTSCVGHSHKSSKNRAGTVAGIVIAALFVVIIAFFLYVRQQRKAATYEAIQ